MTRSGKPENSRIFIHGLRTLLLHTYAMPLLGGTFAFLHVSVFSKYIVLFALGTSEYQ